MKLITLSIGLDGNWWATFSGEDAETVRNLFGTNSIITPFNSHADSSTVEAHIRRLNPGYEVEVKSSYAKPTEDRQQQTVK